MAQEKARKVKARASHSTKDQARASPREEGHIEVEISAWKTGDNAWQSLRREPGAKPVGRKVSGLVVVSVQRSPRESCQPSKLSMMHAFTTSGSGEKVPRRQQGSFAFSVAATLLRCRKKHSRRERTLVTVHLQAVRKCCVLLPTCCPKNWWSSCKTIPK